MAPHGREWALVVLVALTLAALVFAISSVEAMRWPM